MLYDEKYMRRALQLAQSSPFDTHPNPMVGAVIVCDDKIIGEGFHRRCGEPHAEVNAIASVSDQSLLSRSTIYVTLEPCSHYGKTPPCAQLIIDKAIPRVVIGAVDPFEKVAGRGIAMLQQAGIEVVSGVLDDECRKLNQHFFKAHTRRRPFITIKWAQSADGFLDCKRSHNQPAYRFSNSATTMLTHCQRAAHDAILTTAATYLADTPSLIVRHWDGPNPRRFIFDRSYRLSNSPTEETSSINDSQIEGFTIISGDLTIEQLFTKLYDMNVTSVLVEAGPRFLQAIIDSGIYDAVRIESSPTTLGSLGTHPAPTLP